MLQNVDTHKSCYCYKDGKGSVIEIKDIENETEGSVDIHEQEIVFVIKGSVHFTIKKDNASRKLRAKEFVFFPIGNRVLYKASAKSVVMIVRLNIKVPECHVFRIDKVSTCVNKYNGIYALRANDRMQYYISGLLENLRDGLRCKIFMNMEVCRMLFLLHAYYPQEQYVKFFSHVASPDVMFSEFVRLNYLNYRTIDELAAALNMTRQQFTSRFKKVFGVLPHKWIQQEKAQIIYQAICRSDIPLKEISFMYGFSIHSNFIRFCRQNYGNSPGELRKNIINGCTPKSNI